MDGKGSLSPQGDSLEMPLGLISGKILFPWPSVLPVGFQLPVLETEAVVGLGMICVPRAVKQQKSSAPALLCFGSLGKHLKNT